MADEIEVRFTLKEAEYLRKCLIRPPGAWDFTLSRRLAKRIEGHEADVRAVQRMRREEVTRMRRRR